MNKDEFIEIKNDEVDEEISKAKKENNNRKTVAGFAGIFFTTLGIVTNIAVPGTTIAALAIGGSAFIHRNFYKKKKEQEINNLESVKKHLEKVKNETLDPRLNMKRKNKISQLKKLKSKYKSKLENLKYASKIEKGATMAGAFLTMINPLFAIIPLSGIIANMVISNKKLKAAKKVSDTDRRISNLENDLGLIAISRTPTPRALGSNENHSKEFSKSKAKANDLNENLVDVYISEMEQQKISETQNQKVKK